MLVDNLTDKGLYREQRRRDGVYRRIRSKKERKIIIKWLIHYSNNAYVDMTTTIDVDEVNYSWKDWDKIKYDSIGTEQIKKHIEELFKHQLGWNIKEVKDVGTAYEGDLNYTLRDILEREWENSLLNLMGCKRHFTPPTDQLDDLYKNHRL